MVKGGGGKKHDEKRKGLKAILKVKMFLFKKIYFEDKEKSLPIL